MKCATLPLTDGDRTLALRSFLKNILTTGLARAVLVPRMLPSGDGFVQSLVTDPALLDQAYPLAPTMAVQSARILSELTSSPVAGKIAAVLRPCEVRASVELTKFLQVSLDQSILITMDCTGTIEVSDYAALAAPQRDKARLALEGGTVDLPDEVPLRAACRICTMPEAAFADITVATVGGNGDLTLIVGDRLGAEAAEKLSLHTTEADVPSRDKALETLRAGRAKNREAVLSDLRQRTAGLDKLMDTLSTCIRCHNCMNVCPICYCKECVFHSTVFEHRADQLLKLASRQGAVRMPRDTMMFHLTRFSHMATSCVACGMCESACPNGLPLSSLFALVGGDLQAMFDYVPGRSPEERPPVSVFKENELQAVAGDE